MPNSDIKFQPIFNKDLSAIAIDGHSINKERKGDIMWYEWKVVSLKTSILKQVKNVCI